MLCIVLMWYMLIDFLQPSANPPHESSGQGKQQADEGFGSSHGACVRAGQCGRKEKGGGGDSAHG